MSEQINRRDLFRLGGVSALTAVVGSAADSAPGLGRAESKPRLGLVSYNVAKDWDLDTLLKNCREAGFEGAEFRTTHAHGVEPSLDSARRKEIKQKCADSGLKQTSLGSICEFHSTDPAVVRQNVETCRQFVELAKDIGARGVKVRPNGLPKDVPPEKTLEQIGKTLAECGKFAADSGIEIWVEVHGGGTSLPANCRKILEICGHPSVGITWNSNATDLVDGSVKQGFETLRPFIRCAHINDLWGSYPYRELFTLMNLSGFDGFTLIECGFTIRAEDGIPFLKCYKGLWKELIR
jgi:sugar phosphate isomerase/epimerase